MKAKSLHVNSRKLDKIRCDIKISSTKRLTASAINDALRGTNFGDSGETDSGRRRLMAECVLKVACGFADGWTITRICKDLDMITNSGNPRKWAKQWAYYEIMH